MAKKCSSSNSELLMLMMTKTREAIDSMINLNEISKVNLDNKKSMKGESMGNALVHFQDGKKGVIENEMYNPYMISTFISVDQLEKK